MHRTLSLALAGLLALGAATLPSGAEAGSYPTNKCVSAKQKAAAKYCQSAFKAWSKWEATQTNSGADSTRNEALASAADKLRDAWDKAEDKSEKKGIDCSETTETADTVLAAAEPAIAAIAGGADAGSDTGDKSDLKCRSKILGEIGKYCAGIFKAESKHITTTTRDPLRERLAAAKSRSLDRYNDKIGSAGTCIGDPGALAIDVDVMVAAAVEDTIITPAIPVGVWTEILPEEGGVEYLGRNLNTVCSDGTPWKMWARRGTTNNLVVYYQGGGACWDHTTCALGVCDPNVQDSSDHPDNFEFGFANFNLEDNPVGDWNAIFVPYCSCDIHWGNTRTFYPGPLGLAIIEHRGRINSSFAEKWAREHFVNPDSIVVTGSSAGGYGALSNNLFLHEIYGSSRFAVIGDGSLGVVTPDFVENDINNWGILGELPTHIPALNVNSLSGLSIADMVADSALYYEDRGSLFSQYSTIDDWNQAIFYNAQVRDVSDADFGNWKADVCDWESQAVALTQDIAERAPNNFRYFIGPGTDHTAWGHEKVYTEAVSRVDEGGSITVRDWLADMATDPPGPNWTNVLCDKASGECDHVCQDFTGEPFNFTCGGDPEKHQDGSTGPIPAPCGPAGP